MWLDLSTLGPAPSPVPELEIHPVRDDTDLRVWMRVWACGAPPEVEQRWYDVYRQLPYGPDGDLRMFVGYLAGQPVATCYLHRTGSVAAVHYVVTIPSHRRRGIGAAVTHAALRHARAAGCRFAVLTASPDGLGVYRRLGFRECSRVATFEWYPR
jgi:ribosomal protein S18 acetylase RimI-like enzyme